ncbi:MAG: glycine/betaine ABC transporter substrate-binding protein [Boseongicola sp.]|nr:glycine/betaine ABC transporter substrate-binding protein [Boseongicola sp.]
MIGKLAGMLTAAAIGFGSPMAMAQERVNVAAPNWSSATAIAHLIKVLVDQKVGGEATLVPGTNATIYQGMDRGKGDIDVHPDIWLPNQSNFTKEYVDGKGTVVLSQNHYAGKQGFCVSKGFQERTGVTSIYDLARPDIAEMLDSDGDGKGEIWIGAPGWNSANVNEIKVRDYGLLAFIEPFRAEQTVNTNRVGDRIAKGEGVAFYCYAPEAIWFMHDIVQLDEPPHDPARYKVVQASEDPDWLAKSYVETADAPREVQIGYSRSLEDRAPNIVKLLNNIALDTDTVSGWAFEMIVNKREPEDVIREWVATNSDRVDGWLGLN